jgi:DtxR family Mn-dependent transcriptional regulator
MVLSDEAQEVLEAWWEQGEERERDQVPLADLGEHASEAALAELQTGGLAVVQDGLVSLTPAGTAAARLAERLLADLLETKASLLEEAACKFEHALHEGIDERVCALLGHPKVCPHGRPIPPGACCQAHEAGVRLVARLSELDPGAEGEIAYVLSEDPEKLKKLMAMGILPGMRVQLVRQFPSYVFDIGHTQYAVDREMADEIYVRLTGHAEAQRRPGPRWRGGWRRRR